MPLPVRIMFYVLITLILVATVASVVREIDGIDRTNAQVTAVAEDLGCKVIEQSYHHPENFYIDCGNDEIRIIKQEK